MLSLSISFHILFAIFHIYYSTENLPTPNVQHMVRGLVINCTYPRIQGVSVTWKSRLGEEWRPRNISAICLCTDSYGIRKPYHMQGWRLTSDEVYWSYSMVCDMVGGELRLAVRCGRKGNRQEFERYTVITAFSITLWPM